MLRWLCTDGGVDNAADRRRLVEASVLQPPVGAGANRERTVAETWLTGLAADGAKIPSQSTHRSPLD
jgi:hypothetical protein